MFRVSGEKIERVDSLVYPPGAPWNGEPDHKVSHHSSSVIVSARTMLSKIALSMVWCRFSSMKMVFRRNFSLLFWE